MNGGLSLEHFDAARPDPGDAAMVVSKMKSGAFGAAGIPPPDKGTQEALIAALSSAAAGANEWTVSRRENVRTQAPILTVSVVQGVPSTRTRASPTCTGSRSPAGPMRAKAKCCWHGRRTFLKTGV
jgi:hypothetical protein